jgi:hypothetical protein
MKKIFTLLFFIALSIGLFAQIKIGYINAIATPYPEDSVLKIIQSVPNTTVTILTAQTTAQNVNYYSNYDIIVLAENVASSNVEALALKDTLKKANKPYLNFKMFMYGKGSTGNTWKIMGGAANCPISNTANDSMIVIPSAYKSHSLFNGITIPEDGRIQVIKKIGQDGWVTANVDPKERGMQAAIFSASYTYADKGIVLARPGSYKGIGFDTAFIHEITADKYLAIGIFGGPPTTGTSPKILPILTADGYQIVKNAVEYMKTFIPTKVSSLTKSKIIYFQNGNNIQIDLSAEQKSIVSIFTLSGKLIYKKAINSSVFNYDFNGKSKGIYIVKIEGPKVNAIHKFAIQ